MNNWRCLLKAARISLFWKITGWISIRVMDLGREHQITSDRVPWLSCFAWSLFRRVQLCKLNVNLGLQGMQMTVLWNGCAWPSTSLGGGLWHSTSGTRKAQLNILPILAVLTLEFTWACQCFPAVMPLARHCDRCYASLLHNALCNSLTSVVRHLLWLGEGWMTWWSWNFS